MGDENDITEEDVDFVASHGSFASSFVSSSDLSISRYSPRGLELRIAGYAEKLIADPEHNVITPRPEKPRPGVKPGPVRENSLLLLQQLAGDADPVIRRLSMLSLAAVFKDILPGYRIRDEDAPSGAAARVKKDMLKLREFEQALLRGYQRFLSHCEGTATRGEAATPGAPPPPVEDAPEEGEEAPSGSGKRVHVPTKEFRAAATAARRARVAAKRGMGAYHADGDTLKALGVTAVSCMCALLQAVPHFNFRSNLIGFIVPRMCSKDAATADACITAVAELFTSDVSGEACVDCVRAVNTLVKDACKRPQGLRSVSPGVVEVLAKLRIASHLERVATSRESELRGASGKAKAKKGKLAGNPYDENDVLSSLRAADAEALEERKVQALNCLRGVITVCFRILRGDGATHLLSATLKALARIAHLIDVDVTQDLLTSLQQLLAEETTRALGRSTHEAPTSAAEAGGGDGWPAGAPESSSSSRLGVEATLNCVLTAVRILSGPGEILNASDAPFASALYATLLRLLGPGEHVHAPLAAEAMRSLLILRSPTPSRVAAFVSRCHMLSLHLPVPAAACLLTCARTMIARQPSLACMFDAPDERVMSAVGTQAATSIDLAKGSRGAILDPDRSAAMNSGTWELVALQAHWHPHVRSMAAEACKRVPTGSHADAMYAAYDDATGSFNPPVAAPPAHASRDADGDKLRFPRACAAADWWVQQVEASAHMKGMLTAELSGAADVAHTADTAASDEGVLPALEGSFTDAFSIRTARRAASTRRVLKHVTLLQMLWNASMEDDGDADDAGSSTGDATIKSVAAATEPPS